MPPLLLWVAFTANGRAAVNRWSTSGPAAPINCLALDPGDPRVLYAGGNTGVFKSTDFGMSWRPANGSSQLDFTSALAIDPLSTSIVYAAASQGVLQSTDGGNSWKTLLPGPTATSLAINPANPSIVYAGTQGGEAPPEVYESKDRGASWNVAFTDLAQEIASLLLDPQKPSAIFEADYDYDYVRNPDYVGFSTVYGSTDDGANWKSVGKLPAGVSRNALVIDPANSAILYAGTRMGLYKSPDAGASWSLASFDLATADVQAVAIDPRHPGIFYVGTRESGIYRSVDGGVHWSAFNDGLPSLYVDALAIDSTGTRLHAGTGLGVFDYQFPPGDIDLAVGAGGVTHSLSVDLDNRVVLRSTDASGESNALGPLGPYGAWTPAAIADGADSLTRVLWNNPDGRTGLWLVDAEGTRAAYLLATVPGFQAADVAASIGGATHILWTDTDGRVAISSVDNLGQTSPGPTYGPYAGWTAVAAADGPDGLTRVLWRCRDGRTAISFAQDGILLASHAFGAVADWTALDIAVGGDGMTRILWSDGDQRTALWAVDSEGRVTTRGPVYPAPAGMSAARLAAGPDGSSRILFTDNRGGASVWLLSPTGVLVGTLD